MRRVDVVKFGGTYCPQNGEAAEVLAEVLAACPLASGRRNGRNALVTRRLREAGLVVVTPTSITSGRSYRIARTGR